MDPPKGSERRASKKIFRSNMAASRQLEPDDLCELGGSAWRGSAWRANGSFMDVGASGDSRGALGSEAALHPSPFTYRSPSEQARLMFTKLTPGNSMYGGKWRRVELLARRIVLLDQAASTVAFAVGKLPGM